MRCGFFTKFLITSVAIVSISGLLTPKTAFAQAPTQASKIFINSCIYGTMTGTLLGLGSLALADNPKDKLQRVFRGASLGLYAGIILGAYIIYGVTDEEEKRLEEYTNPDDITLNYPIVYPLITERGFEGAAMDLTVLRF